jgi:hypothetical protein
MASASTTKNAPLSDAEMTTCDSCASTIENASTTTCFHSCGKSECDAHVKQFLAALPPRAADVPVAALERIRQKMLVSTDFRWDFQDFTLNVSMLYPDLKHAFESLPLWGKTITVNGSVTPAHLGLLYSTNLVLFSIDCEPV